MKDKVKQLWIKQRSLIIIMLIVLLAVILFGISNIPAKAVTITSDNSYLSTQVIIRINANVEKDK